VNMSLVKYNLKDFDESLQNARLALKINPNNQKALFRVATIMLDRDNYEAASQVLFTIFLKRILQN